MFVAKFDPPIIVSYATAMQIYGSTSVALDMYHTFDSLMLPHASNDKAEPGETRTIKNQATVTVFGKDGEKSKSLHNNSLFIEKFEHGYTLSELPFSHPKQLVEILPPLRQYAFLSTLLRKSFEATANISQQTEKVKESPAFDDFLYGTPSTVTDDTAITVDISFTTQPLPRLQLIFPFKNGMGNVEFDIKLNGVVEIASQNLLPVDLDMDEGSADKKLTVDALSKMLEITEDLGIWIEWVRRRLA
jgi:hypothetical protein